MANEEYFLWSNYQNDGETTTVRTPNGADRNVVLSRNVLPAGSKVKESDFKGDGEWEALLEAGVVRSYPFPDDIPAGSLDSPIVHMQKKLNVAAQSEEERLMASIQGSTSSDESLAEAAAEAKSEEKK